MSSSASQRFLAVASRSFYHGTLPAGSQSGPKFSQPSGPCGALEAMMDDGGQVTLGAISGMRAAAVAAMPAGMRVINDLQL
jgi:hypothetical protein